MGKEAARVSKSSQHFYHTIRSHIPQMHHLVLYTEERDVTLLRNAMCLLCNVAGNLQVSSLMTDTVMFCESPNLMSVLRSTSSK
jgi:hypothetical protein